ncbi:MAG: PGPGW domain-containing protein [Bryobacteraceae bacterium]
MLRRLVRIVVGFLMVVAGLIMALPGVPGPGLLTALGGLVILSEHFRWARRLLGWLKKQAVRARDKARGHWGQTGG